MRVSRDRMKFRYKEGTRVRLHLTGLAQGGDALGRHEGFVFFVPRGAPGDEAIVTVEESKRNYARGALAEIVSPSPLRIEAPCPLYERCGGCHLQHLSYEGQLSVKRAMVVDALKNPGGFARADSMVSPCLPSPEPWEYRTKAQFIAGSGPVLGYYRRGTHEVVEVPACSVLKSSNNIALRVTAAAVKELDIPPYDERAERGMLRHVAVRVSAGGEGLVTLIAAVDSLPHERGLVERLVAGIPGLKGIVLNVNRKKTNVILGKESRVLWGEDGITEEVEGVRFRISSSSFFQVNGGQLRNLCGLLREFLSQVKAESVLDAYAGVGVFALHSAGSAGRVVGMEESAEAVKDSLMNAQLNDVGNVAFLLGRVERLLPAMRAQGEQFDAAVLDPPRKGCEPPVLDTLASMGVRAILYISCNPVTFARDMAVLSSRGYEAEEIRPLDMFPQTAHVEIAACIVRRM
jgi:23S rRNA (uracil1939-C5)-methyltransferase